MSIRVCGLHDVKEHLDWADFIVSINDPGKKSPIKNHKHVPVHFEDTEQPGETEFYQMRGCVQRVLDKVSAAGISLDSNILVHCRAGVSRSSAVAWLILIKLGMDYRDAFTLLYQQHPGIWPNCTVLGIGAVLMRQPIGFTEFYMQVDAEIASKRNKYLGYGG